MIPVAGETVMVAGDSTIVLCGVVRTARVETRTVRGLSWLSGGVEAGVGYEN